MSYTSSSCRAREGYLKQSARIAGIDHLAPHDLRRSCARLCHESGGELEQIQFLLEHASVLTTERYLGFKQKLREPVNDRFQISRIDVESVRS
jgi:site-specific recombinase XerD